MRCTGEEIFCEDFESTADGAVPGSPWIRDSSCQYQEGSGSGQFSLGASSQKVHQGERSLKLTNTSWAQCRLSAPFGQEEEFWVRSFVYWDTENEASWDDRELLELDLTTGEKIQDDSTAIRFGYRSKAPCTEQAGPQVTMINIGGGEQTGCSTTQQYPKGEWYCFEAHVQQKDKTIVRTFINGTALSYSSQGKETTTSIETPNNSEVKVDHIRLGLFGTTQTQGVVYIDDVAITKERVGCGN